MAGGETSGTQIYYHLIGIGIGKTVDVLTQVYRDHHHHRVDLFDNAEDAVRAFEGFPHDSTKIILLGHSMEYTMEQGYRNFCTLKASEATRNIQIKIIVYANDVITHQRYGNSPIAYVQRSIAEDEKVLKRRKELMGNMDKSWSGMTQLLFHYGVFQATILSAMFTARAVNHDQGCQLYRTPFLIMSTIIVCLYMIILGFRLYYYFECLEKLAVELGAAQQQRSRWRVVDGGDIFYLFQILRPICYIVYSVLVLVLVGCTIAFSLNVPCKN